MPGVIYCKNCVEHAKCCDSCRRPVLEEDSWALGDGRFLCNDCSENGVFDVQIANEYFLEMREFLQSEFGLVIDIPVKFKFVTTVILQNLFGKRTSPGAMVRGLFRYQGGDDFVTIYILYGLTKTEFQAVTAHEYTHVWQKINSPRDQSLMIQEGFACWIEYHVYKKNGDRKGVEKVEKRDDPIYGDGLKKVRQIAKERGYVGLLQDMKTKVV
jgi:hypothetical protein